MRISNEGLNLIKKWEGFCPKPYKCSAGVPTIGYGATFYPNGKKVTMEDKPISEAQALAMLSNMVTNNFQRYVDSYVIPEVKQNQFDALVSLSYNIGVGAFKGSTLLKLVNANPNDPKIANEFMKWNKVKGKEIAGLTNRRKEEVAMYFQKPSNESKPAEKGAILSSMKEFLKSLLNS